MVCISFINFYIVSSCYIGKKQKARNDKIISIKNILSNELSNANIFSRSEQFRARVFYIFLTSKAE